MDIAKLFGVEGKAAIVTGASKGIGKELARTLAEAGARVALIARDRESLETFARELAAEGRDVLALPCDVTNVEAVSDTVDHVHRHFGRIDILINNAGVNIPKPAVDVTERDWDAVLDLNLKSAFFCSQAAARHMLSQKQGKIVTISSQMALVGYYDRTAYCASKGGVTQMTKALAIEWASRNINVNAVAPTFIETPLTRPMLADPAFREEVLGRIPMGRLAKPEDLFGAVLYLCSPASDMVTGQTIVVDGGWTVW